MLKKLNYIFNKSNKLFINDEFDILLQDLKEYDKNVLVIKELTAKNSDELTTEEINFIIDNSNSCFS